MNIDKLKWLPKEKPDDRRITFQNPEGLGRIFEGSAEDVCQISKRIVKIVS